MRKLIIIPFLLLALTTIGQNTTVDTLRFKRGGKAWQVITWGNSDSVKINGIVFKMGGTGDSFWEATGPSAQYIKPAYPPTFGIKYPLIQYMNEPNTPKGNCQVWWRHSDGALVGPVHNEPGGGGLGEPATVDGSIPIYYNDTANRTVYVTADSIRNIYAPFVISNRGKNSTVIVQSLESRPFDTLEQLELHYGDWAMIYPDSTVFHFITGSRSNNQVVYVPDSLIVPPRTDLIVQWLDGTRIGNEFIDISGHGYNVDIINNDIALERGFPYKSAAMIAQKAANFGAIPDTNHFWFQADGTPNQIPVTSLFQNIDYSGLIFSRHVGQVLSASGEETTEPYVTDIITYSTPLKQADITDAELFFSVPKLNPNAKWVDFDAGNDTYGTGIKGKPYATMLKAESVASTGDTVYIMSGANNEPYIQPSKGITWIGVGLVVVKSQTTSNGVFRITSSNQKNFEGLIVDGQSANMAVGFYSTAQNSRFSRCKFQNLWTTGNAVNFQYAGTISGNWFEDCIFNYSRSNGYMVFEADSIIGCHISGECNSIFYSERANAAFKYNRVRMAVNSIANVVYNAYNITGNDYINTGKGTFFQANGSNATTGNKITYNTIRQGDISGQNFILLKGTGVKYGHNSITLTGTSTTSTDNQSYIVVGTSLPHPEVYNNFFDITSSRPYSVIRFTSGGSVCGATVIRNNKVFLRNAIDCNPIEVGSENDVSYTGKNDGTIMANNYILMPAYYGGTWGASHGIFLSGGSGQMYGNLVYGSGIGMIQKGQGATFTTVMHHNIFLNCRISMYSKAVSGMKIYNNTIHTATTSADSPSVFDIVKNGSYLPANNEIKNNIIIGKGTSPGFVIYTIDDAGIPATLTADYNQVYTISDNTAYNSGTWQTWTDWRAAGFDAHSTYGDIAFRSVYDFKMWPTATITGTDLGSSYNTGLSINTKIGDTIKTATQGVNWQMGAYVQNGEAETTDTVKQLPYQVTAGDVKAWTKAYELANSTVSFPGFGTSHATAAYGDHNHTGVYQPVGSYLTAETDPNVSAWAKSPTKPTYTYSEVGAQPAGNYLTGLSVGTYSISVTGSSGSCTGNAATATTALGLTSGTYSVSVTGTSGNISLAGTPGYSLRYISGAWRAWPDSVGSFAPIASPSFTTQITTPKLIVTQPAINGGAGANIVTITGGTQTGVDASSEVTDLNCNLARTIQHNTGALTNQRSVVISTPTLSFVGASTVSDADGFVVQGPPTGGTNATITEACAIVAESKALTGVTTGIGIKGVAPTGATTNWAGYFSGNVKVTGTLDAPPKSFYSFAGSYASSTTLTLTGSQATADMMWGSLFRWESSGGAIRYGWIEKAVYSAGTITCTCYGTAAMASGDKNYYFSPSIKAREFERRITIPGPTSTDASNPVGMWFQGNASDSLAVFDVSAWALVGAAGTGSPACAFNLYHGSTNLFSAAIDLGTGTSSLHNVPSAVTIVPPSTNMTLRITSAVGTTNTATDFQCRYFAVPTRIYWGL